uniref:Uncharacterized protein n=1 Tax=Mycena chlorophos TaxID=658473 RepID=A0ABQ0L595_MYCCL|nr:predicted protein [Mycena chlorophos]
MVDVSRKVGQSRVTGPTHLVSRDHPILPPSMYPFLVAQLDHFFPDYLHLAATPENGPAKLLHHFCLATVATGMDDSLRARLSQASASPSASTYPLRRASTRCSKQNSPSKSRWCFAGSGDDGRSAWMCAEMGCMSITGTGYALRVARLSHLRLHRCIRLQPILAVFTTLSGHRRHPRSLLGLDRRGAATGVSQSGVSMLDDAKDQSLNRTTDGRSSLSSPSLSQVQFGGISESTTMIPKKPRMRARRAERTGGWKARLLVSRKNTILIDAMRKGFWRSVDPKHALRLLRQIQSAPKKNKPSNIFSGYCMLFPLPGHDIRQS